MDASSKTGQKPDPEAEKKAAEAKATEETRQAEEKAKAAEAQRVADEQAAAAAPEEEKTDFTREELLANAYELTGYSGVALAGGLSGLDSETFTVEQAKTATKEFLERPVENEDDDEEKTS